VCVSVCVMITGATVLRTTPNVADTVCLRVCSSAWPTRRIRYWGNNSLLPDRKKSLENCKQSVCRCFFRWDFCALVDVFSPFLTSQTFCPLEETHAHALSLPFWTNGDFSQKMQDARCKMQWKTLNDFLGRSRSL